MVKNPRQCRRPLPRHSTISVRRETWGPRSIAREVLRIIASKLRTDTGQTKPYCGRGSPPRSKTESLRMRNEREYALMVRTGDLLDTVSKRMRVTRGAVAAVYRKLCSQGVLMQKAAYVTLDQEIKRMTDNFKLMCDHACELVFGPAEEAMIASA